MVTPLLFLILQAYSVLATTSTTAAQVPAVAPTYTDYSSLWSRFFSNPGLQSQAQAYSSPVPATKVSPQVQGYAFPSTQFPQNQAYGYTQLVPFYQQPSLNLTQNQSASAVTGYYPGLQSYYPSSFGNFPSWPQLSYSGLQPQSSASVSSSTTANRNPLTFSSPTYTFQNGLGLYGQNSLYGQNQQYLYPGFPYSQPYIETGLPQSQQQTSDIYGLNQGTTQATSDDSAPKTNEDQKYSSKYKKPQSSYSVTANKHGDDDVYDDAGDSHRSKPADNYKNSQTYKNHRPTYDDEEDDEDSHKSSYDYAEDKERPKYTRPSDDDDDDYEQSSPSQSYHTKDCYNSSPSGSASSDSPTFSEDGEAGINNFAKQFKAFTKSGDFSPEPSNHQKITEHYNEPKHLKMTYNEDSYSSSTKFKNSESPKTFHRYVYKAPKYSYEKSVDYLPDKQTKATSEKMHVTRYPYHRDSEGHHSITATVTTMKKYR